MKLTLPYPVKPYKVTQVWGIPSQIYEQFGFSRHNGVDVALGTDKSVYSELDGMVYNIAWQPTGGGLYVSILSNSTFTFDDGVECFVLIDYLHLQSCLVQAGQEVKVGDKLAIADNTGFSTGPHTHCQYRRVRKVVGKLEDVDKNDAHDSFDPEPYRNGYFAQDTAQVISILQRMVGLLKLVLAIKK